MVCVAGSKFGPGDAFELPPQQAGGSVRAGAPCSPRDPVPDKWGKVDEQADG